MPLGDTRVTASYHGDDADDDADADADAAVVRFDVQVTADFRPEGFLAAFKGPLDAVMLSSLLKSAREISSWFAACSASDAGVGPSSSPPPPLELVAVGPRLPKELAYLRMRRLSLDGPPGVSRGMSAEEADELSRAAAASSERALALALRGEKRKGVVGSPEEGGGEKDNHGQQHQPATPERDPCGGEQRSVLSRVSLDSSPSHSFSSSCSFSSVESFLSAASELPENNVAAPATPAAKEKRPGRKSSNSSSRKHVLHMPRWLSSSQQAKEVDASTDTAAAADEEGAATGTAGAPSPPSRRRRPGSAPLAALQPTTLPVLKRWLRPKSARD